MWIVWVWLAMSVLGLSGAARILHRARKRRQDKQNLPDKHPVKVQANFRFWVALIWTVGMLAAIAVAVLILLDLSFPGISIFVIMLLQAIAVGVLTWDDRLDTIMTGRRRQ